MRGDCYAVVLDNCGKIQKRYESNVRHLGEFNGVLGLFSGKGVFVIAFNTMENAIAASHFFNSDVHVSVHEARQLRGGKHIILKDEVGT